MYDVTFFARKHASIKFQVDLCYKYHLRGAYSYRKSPVYVQSVCDFSVTPPFSSGKPIDNRRRPCPAAVRSRNISNAQTLMPTPHQPSAKEFAGFYVLLFIFAGFPPVIGTTAAADTLRTQR
jgi:hypothetical protein